MRTSLTIGVVNLVENHAPVGLQLNVQKTDILTTQAQPPSQLQTPNGLIISVLDRESSHKLTMIYAAWMLHIANFYDLWWGLLAIWTGHYHGMKFFTSGMSAFGASPRRPRLNHGLKFVYGAIGIWHNTSQHLGIVGSKRLWFGNHRGIDALAAQNIAGIICLQIFAA